MSKNRFRGRELLPETNLRVAALVESRLVDDESGLYVVFEDREIAWPGLPRCEPFYVARHDFDREGPEAGTPQEIGLCLSQSGWDHFIWMPISFARGDANRFTIRYAHELQHYRQVLGVESLRHARAFLSRLRRQGFVPSLRVEKDPTEFDAEIVAIDTFEAVHGRSAWDAFIEREDIQMGDYYRRVLFLRERFKKETQNASV